MLHAVASILFISVFTKWLASELKVTVSLRQHWAWVWAAVGVTLFASLLEYWVGGKAGNFLLHSIGGGVLSTFLFVYLLKTFNFKFSLGAQAVLLFAFVSSLGALNELFEYAAEMSGWAIMSFDTHDTWRDFVANTTGAFVAWGIIHVISELRAKNK